MRKVRTVQVRCYLLALIVIVALSTGCAQNKPVALDTNHASEFSAYLFSAGSVLYYSNDFAQAEELFRMASLYDPYSVTIRKAIFSALQVRVKQNEVPVAYFSGYADSLLALHIMDKEMLEAAYNVYAVTGEYQKAKSILDLYMKKYKSAGAYASLFYIEQTLNNKTRPDLLDKAFKLAGSDADLLITLGLLYQKTDTHRAEEIWQAARRYDTTNQSTLLLWNSYSQRNDKTKLKQLFDSYSLPDDRDKLLVVINHALGENNHNSVILLKDEILSSKDPEIIFTLLGACWFAKNDVLFEQCWSVLQNMKLEKLSNDLKNLYGALHFLSVNQQSKALECLAGLNGKETLDQFIEIYRGTSLEDATEKDIDKFERIVHNLHTVFSAASDEQLAPPVKHYLLTVTDSLQYDNAINASDSLTFPMVDWFYKNNRQTYDTYYWLALYYFRTKQDSLQKTVLREAMDEYPDDATLLNWLGYSYVLSQDNLDEAEVLIKRALQLSPDSAYYLDSLGWLYFIKGDVKQAVSYMEKPSQLEQMPSEIAYHLGAIYHADNNNDAAIRFLKLAIEVNDDPDSVLKAKTLLESLP